jgi:hypothetical protein
MTAVMKVGVAFLLVWSCGCVQLPAVSMRVRARFERGERSARRSLEARVDCGWSLGNAPRRRDVQEPLAAFAEDGPWLEREALPCEVARACAWEDRERGAALAALMPDASTSHEGEAP